MAELGNGGYWYNSGQDIGPMPIEDETGLDYGQKLFLPYFGVAFEYQYKRFNAILTFKNSFLNYARVFDRHYARTNIDDNESIENYGFFYNYSLSLDVGYWILDRLRVFMIFDVMQTLKDKTTNRTIFGKDIGYMSYGMSNLAYSISVGMTFDI